MVLPGSDSRAIGSWLHFRFSFIYYQHGQPVVLAFQVSYLILPPGKSRLEMPRAGRSNKRAGKGASSAVSKASRSTRAKGRQSRGAAGTNDDNDDNASQIPARSFPGFGRLPTELRLIIWELSHAAVLGNGLIHKITKHSKYDSFIAAMDNDQDTAVRTILSISRESRHVALTKTLPDEVPHPFGRAIIRANLAHDIFLLCDDTARTAGWIPEYDPTRAKPALYSLARNIGVTRSTVTMWGFQRNIGNYENVFPALENLYVVVDDSRYSTKNLRWCRYVGRGGVQFSATVGFKHVLDGKGRGPARDPRWFAETDMDPNALKIPARKREYKQRYCWPDVGARASGVVGNKIPWDRLEGMHKLRGWSDESIGWFSVPMFTPVTVKAWPLIEWGEHGMSRLEKILGWNGNEDEWEDTDHSDEDELPIPDESDKWSEYSP